MMRSYDASTLINTPSAAAGAIQLADAATLAAKRVGAVPRPHDYVEYLVEGMEPILQIKT